MLSAATCRSSTGTEDASNARTKGGVIPSGSCLITVCEMAVTCAWAAATSVPGWKKILTMPLPYSDWLSMCSMPLTVVVKARS